VGIRERTWTSGGEKKTAWVCEYFDADRKWRLKTFRTKKEAKDFEATARTDIKQGRHVADAASITVKRAGELWIERAEEEKLLQSSLTQYDEHLRLHITPFIGDMKLSKLNPPAIRAFASKLRAAAPPRSDAMVKKVLTSLGGIFADAHRRGLASHNPVADMRDSGRKRRTKGERAARKKKLVVGVDIPLPAEIRAIVKAANVYRRALVLTAAQTGLRISELRALRWQDLDVTAGTITVAQRADAWNEVDVPKSEAGERVVPLSPDATKALKEWRLQCPKRPTGRTDADGEPIMELHYVFPNGKGKVESQQNIVQRHWHPAQIAAGVTAPSIHKRTKAPRLDEKGNQLIGARYSGFHCLRHFFCSWCAASKEKGGLGLTLQEVSELMGHSDPNLTASILSASVPG
jgi:integrase